MRLNLKSFNKFSIKYLRLKVQEDLLKNVIVFEIFIIFSTCYLKVCKDKNYYKEKIVIIY